MNVLAFATRDQSRSARKRAVRAVTLGRIGKRELALGALAPVIDISRPRTWGDCLPGGMNEQRPCPWVSCRHHLYLDVGNRARPDAVKLNFPDLAPEQLEHSCSLDLASRDGLALEDVGQVTNLTRERVRQIEMRGLLVVKRRHLPLLREMNGGKEEGDRGKIPSASRLRPPPPPAEPVELDEEDDVGRKSSFFDEGPPDRYLRRVFSAYLADSRARGFTRHELGGQAQVRTAKAFVVNDLVDVAELEAKADELARKRAHEESGREVSRAQADGRGRAEESEPGGDLVSRRDRGVSRGRSIPTAHHQAPPTERAGEAAKEEPMKSKTDAVLEALAKASTALEISAATSLDRSEVSVILSRLVSQGRATREGKGKGNVSYSLAGAAPAKRDRPKVEAPAPTSSLSVEEFLSARLEHARAEVAKLEAALKAVRAA